MKNLRQSQPVPSRQKTGLYADILEQSAMPQNAAKIQLEYISCDLRWMISFSRLSRRDKLAKLNSFYAVSTRHKQAIKRFKKLILSLDNPKYLG